MGAKSGIEVAKLFMDQTTLNDDGSKSRFLTVKQMSWLLSDTSIVLKGDSARHTFELDAKFNGVYKGVLWPDRTGSLEHIPVKALCTGLDSLWPLFKTATEVDVVVSAGEDIIEHISLCSLGHEVMHAETKPRDDIQKDDLSEALPEALSEEEEGTPDGDPLEFDALVEEIANSN